MLELQTGWQPLPGEWRSDGRCPVADLPFGPENSDLVYSFMCAQDELKSMAGFRPNYQD